MNLFLLTTLLLKDFFISGLSNRYLHYGFILYYVPYHEIAHLNVKLTCFGLICSTVVKLVPILAARKKPRHVRV